jgi:hypothetical protein
MQLRRTAGPWRIGLVTSAVVVGLALAARAPEAAPNRIQFLFTSDSHYGLTRASFRGAHDVPAHVVNAALVAAMNHVPTTVFPKDGGIGAGEPVGGIDFVVNAGDIANRAEQTDTASIQSPSASWAEFESDYVHGLTVTTTAGTPAPLYVVPGNHDVSNAIGYYKPMAPSRDGLPYAAMFNLMMKPAVARTAATLAYPRDRIDTSRDLGGLHVVFLTIWPDSTQRAWLETDLAHVPASTPVVIFTHDQPDAESKHFTNPNGEHDINGTDLFENLLVDELADGPTTTTPDLVEQRAFAATLRRHPNIAAYFHGNSNWNQFYEWTGPDHDLALHAFRVDSPMKGAQSGPDETRLSFQVVTLDLAAHAMTVRECLWNVPPTAVPAPLAWGGSTTVALGVR